MPVTQDHATDYRAARVLITGGLGFIGSNLAIRLVELGASVVIVDPEIEGCGANLYNVSSVARHIQVLRHDIADTAAFSQVLRHTDVIFNLAGEISHRRSMELPERDGVLNATAQLRFLKGCVAVNAGVRIVYAGTRQIYGVPRYLPVDEEHPVYPIDFNGVHKRAAMMYHLVFARDQKLDSVVLNLTNVYGPRMAVQLGQQGFLGTYIRRVALGEPPEVYGDGQQLRDPLYVDDAVDAFLIAGKVPMLPSRVYNVGGPRALPIREIAEIMHQVGGTPTPVFKPFPAEQKAIDIGSYRTDSSRIQRELGWVSRIEFKDGIRYTLDYYHDALSYYLANKAAVTSK